MGAGLSFSRALPWTRLSVAECEVAQCCYVSIPGAHPGWLSVSLDSGIPGHLYFTSCACEQVAQFFLVHTRSSLLLTRAQDSMYPCFTRIILGNTTRCR